MKNELEFGQNEKFQAAAEDKTSSFCFIAKNKGSPPCSFSIVYWLFFLADKIKRRTLVSYNIQNY